MTTTLASELTTYRWSSTDEADRFTVQDPATGEAIADIQGGGDDQVSAAVEAANRAFETDWRWRTTAERPRSSCAPPTSSKNTQTSSHCSSRKRTASPSKTRVCTTSISRSTSSGSSAALSTSCRPSSTTRARPTPQPTSSPSVSSARSSPSTGRPSTPAARSRRLSPSATPWSWSRASRPRSR
jgi:hypothetical protein